MRTLGGLDGSHGMCDGEPAWVHEDDEVENFPY